MSVTGVQKLRRERKLHEAVGILLNRSAPGGIEWLTFRHDEQTSCVDVRLDPPFAQCERLQLAFSFREFPYVRPLWACGQKVKGEVWEFLSLRTAGFCRGAGAQESSQSPEIPKWLSYLLAPFALVFLLGLLFIFMALLPFGILMIGLLALVFGAHAEHRPEGTSYGRFVFKCLWVLPLTVIGATVIPRAFLASMTALGYRPDFFPLLLFPGMNLGWGIVGFLATVVTLIVDHFWRRRQIRQLAILPTAKIRSAAIGLCELHGVARAIGGAPAGTVLLSAEAMFHEAFFIEDETGRMLIDPSGAKVRLLRATSFGGRVCEIILDERDGKKGMGRLCDGDPVFLIGRVERNPLPPRAAAAANEALVVRPRKPHWLGLDFNDIFLLSNTSEIGAASKVRQGVTSIWIFAATNLLACVLLTLLGITELRGFLPPPTEHWRRAILTTPLLGDYLKVTGVVEDTDAKRREFLVQLKQAPDLHFERLFPELLRLGEREELIAVAQQLLRNEKEGVSHSARKFLMKQGVAVTYARKHRELPAVLEPTTVVLTDSTLELEGGDLMLSYEVVLGERFFADDRSGASLSVTVQKIIALEENRFTLEKETRAEIPLTSRPARAVRQRVFSDIQPGEYWVNISARGYYYDDEKYRAVDSGFQFLHLKR